MRLCSVELAPWACSALHFIKPCGYGLGMRIIVELKPWPKWKINGRCEGMPLFWRSPHKAFPAIFSVTTTNVLHQMDWCYAVQCVQPTNAIGDAALQMWSAKSSVLAFLSVWLYPTCAETVFSFMLQLQALLLITKCSDHGTLSAATATKKQFGINNNSLIQSDVTGTTRSRDTRLICTPWSSWVLCLMLADRGETEERVHVFDPKSGLLCCSSLALCTSECQTNLIPGEIVAGIWSSHNYEYKGAAFSGHLHFTRKFSREVQLATCPFSSLYFSRVTELSYISLGYIAHWFYGGSHLIQDHFMNGHLVSQCIRRFGCS